MFFFLFDSVWGAVSVSRWRSTTSFVRRTLSKVRKLQKLNTVGLLKMFVTNNDFLGSHWLRQREVPYLHVSMFLFFTLFLLLFIVLTCEPYGSINAAKTVRWLHSHVVIVALDSLGTSLQPLVFHIADSTGRQNTQVHSKDMSGVELILK